ncbi:DUF47 domain-containing protein [Candidatus Gottesmanbacteria bacterium]|nr:DUF47 domain-containing protein [Candidatus Gottesmanbacteria bacterium]
MDFFPKNPRFFDLFIELSKIVNLSGNILLRVKVGSKNINSLAKKTWELEEEADTICHKLFYEADSTFITPIDREDIHIFSRNLDNIIDLIENLTSNIELFNIKREIPQFKPFVKVINKATSKVLQLVTLLKGQNKNIKEMRKIIIEIHSLENEGDRLIRQAFKYLFDNGKNPILVIKWKDLIENMESILDECEDSADIVEEIIVKNF